MKFLSLLLTALTLSISGYSAQLQMEPGAPSTTVEGAAPTQKLPPLYGIQTDNLTQTITVKGANEAQQVKNLVYNIPGVSVIEYDAGGNIVSSTGTTAGRAIAVDLSLLNADGSNNSGYSFLDQSGLRSTSAATTVMNRAASLGYTIH